MNFITFFKPLIHYGLHLILPAILAYFFYKLKFLNAYVIMLGTMLIDLDHLFANPIFDASRCSIGFHPLHSYLAIGIYLLMFFNKKTRVISLGLLSHIAVDIIDCFLSKAL